jgi:hypothetical protein
MARYFFVAKSGGLHTASRGQEIRRSSGFYRSRGGQEQFRQATGSRERMKQKLKR